MPTNVNQTLKYNNRIKGNNNINKRNAIINFFYKKHLICIESMSPLWAPEYIRKA